MVGGEPCLKWPYFREIQVGEILFHLARYFLVQQRGSSHVQMNPGNLAYLNLVNLARRMGLDVFLF